MLSTPKEHQPKANQLYDLYDESTFSERDLAIVRQFYKFMYHERSPTQKQGEKAGRVPNTDSNSTSSQQCVYNDYPLPVTLLTNASLLPGPPCANIFTALMNPATGPTKSAYLVW